MSLASPTAHLAVVCNAAGNSLQLLELSASGQLSPLCDVTLPGVGAANGAYPMTASADGRRLYVAFRGEPHEVLSFAVDPRQRSITLIGRAPLVSSMAHIALSPDGRWLHAASYGGGLVSINPVDEAGVVGPPVDTLAVAGRMHCCLPLPGTDTVLAASLAADAIFSYGLRDGRLTLLPQRAGVAPGSGPRHIVLHPSGRFVLAVTEQAATLCVFGRDEAGLSSVPLFVHSILPPDWQGTGWAADIRLSPDGRFCYASDRRASSIACFALDGETGRPDLAGHIYAPYWPRAFNISPDGRHLLALGEMCNRIDSFAIDPRTGTLAKRDAADTGPGPSWVELFPIPA